MNAPFARPISRFYRRALGAGAALLALTLTMGAVTTGREARLKDDWEVSRARALGSWARGIRDATRQPGVARDIGEVDEWLKVPEPPSVEAICRGAFSSRAKVKGTRGVAWINLVTIRNSNGAWNTNKSSIATIPLRTFNSLRPAAGDMVCGTGCRDEWADYGAPPEQSGDAWPRCRDWLARAW